MKVAIIGAGFTGLAAAWHFVHAGHEVTLFDKTGIGGGASGMAAGLLHSFVGTRAKKSAAADMALKETRLLLDTASEFGPVARYTGILRPAITPDQLLDFQKTATEYEETEWWSASDVQKAVPYLDANPALFIRSGITVDSMRYLQNLWLALEKKGARLLIQNIEQLDELAGEFDRVLSAVGAGVKKFLLHPNLSIVKGQVLETNDNLALPFSIAASAYYTGSCLGASFERAFMDLEPDISTAEAYIRPRMKECSETLSKLHVTRARADARVYTLSKRPTLYQIGDTSFVATGLGARGLLYHALFGKTICESLCCDTHEERVICFEKMSGCFDFQVQRMPVPKLIVPPSRKQRQL